MQLKLGPRLPAWTIRLAMAAVSLGSAALVVPNAVGWLITAGLLTALVVRPGRVLPVVMMLALAAGLALAQPAAFDPTAYVLLAGTHLVITTGAVIGGVSWNAWIEVRALIGPGRRYLTLQAGAQSLALTAAGLSTQHLALGAVPILACIAVALLALWLLRRLTLSVRPSAEAAGDPT